jgi:hypothetical protein
MMKGVRAHRLHVCFGLSALRGNITLQPWIAPCTSFLQRLQVCGALPSPQTTHAVLMVPVLALMLVLVLAVAITGVCLVLVLAMVLVSWMSLMHVLQLLHV